MDYKNWQPTNTMTNDPIEGYVHTDNPKPITHGYARGAELGYCAYDEFGKFNPNVIMGKAAYDQQAAAAKADIEPFINHLKRIFANDPRDVDIFLDYMAFKMQFPGVKPRWGIVIAGEQGVGKDIAIDACWMRYGLNFINNISPNDVMSSYNDFLKCLMLRVSEVADLGEINKWMFNERMKVIISGHPDRMQINPKYGVKHWLTLYNGTILTTNHLESGGFYIPEGDRRYYVIKCATWKQLGLDFDQRADYFDGLFHWFSTRDASGATGYDKIGFYLLWCRDTSNFKPNACPEASKAKIEAQAISSELPQFFLDGLTEYGTSISACPHDATAPFDLYACNTDNLPILINVRRLSALVSNAICTEGNIKDKVTPARLTNLMRQAGYSLLLTPTGGRKWYINGKFETFYYLSDAVQTQAEYSQYLFTRAGIYMSVLQSMAQKEAAF